MAVPASYDVRYIEGPMSLTKFKLLDENKNPIKSAYIFGEYHEVKDKIEGSCPPGSIKFQEYIRRLAEDSPAFIDLYIF